RHGVFPLLSNPQEISLDLIDQFRSRDGDWEHSKLIDNGSGLNRPPVTSSRIAVSSIAAPLAGT
ncbi:MAG TPA: hypothetical protein VFO41_00605, partial [Alphaproteobacteria bacterium]|nr:hypothetical protein [Alphaproteobacteria bacterium]